MKGESKEGRTGGREKLRNKDFRLIETGIDIYTLLYTKWITNKDSLYSTENSTQYSVMTYMGKKSKKGRYMYMYN